MEGVFQIFKNKSMRIVLLTAIPFWHPGTSELINELKKKEISIIAIDVFHGRMLNEKNEILNILPFHIKGLLAKIYLYLFRKQFIKKHIRQDDILDIHFVEPYYSKYLLNLSNKLICSLFGSDLYRTNDNQKQQQKSLFAKANKIVLSENMVPYFEKHFGEMQSKYCFNQYGSARLDQIIKQKQNFSPIEIKNRLNIALDRTIITCGYNNKKEQQHLSIIEQLNKTSKEFKEKAFLIFPMTYGDVQSEYINLVKNALIQGQIPFLLLEKHLSDQEVVELRLISDITINTQTTDALASSIKEAFAAGDIVLVGDWLPYNIYEELGVIFEKINFETLTICLEQIITSLKVRKEILIKNEKIIENFACWNSLTLKWLNLYNSI